MAISDYRAWKKTKEYVDDIVAKALAEKHSEDLFLHPHLKNCLDWGLKINPRASYSAMIALYSHDIDRAFPDRIKRDSYPSYDVYKVYHSLRSGSIIFNFLKKIGASEKLANDVRFIIDNHEIGYVKVDKKRYWELRLVKDADAISFFEVNFDSYLKKHGLEDTKLKLQKMHEKLTNKAKNRTEVKALYERCKDKLAKARKSIIDVITSEQASRKTINDFL